MKTRLNDILAGIFVLVLGLALIAGVLWFGAGRPGRDYDEYLVYLEESVSGLNRDSTVMYYGVAVGHVRLIELEPGDPPRVRLLLELDRGTPVKTDTYAIQVTQGLTGLSNINLLGGSAGAPPLTASAEQTHPVIPSRPSVWGRLDEELPGLMDSLIDVGERLRQLLSDENQAHVSRTLSSLDDLSRQLAASSDRLVQMVDDLAATAASAREASAELPQLVERVAVTATEFDKMANEVSRAAGVIADTVATGHDGLQQFSSEAMPGILDLVAELHLTASNLRRVSEELERNPSILLHGPPPPAPGPGE